MIDKADLPVIGAIFGLTFITIVGVLAVALLLGAALRVFMWGFTGAW